MTQKQLDKKKWEDSIISGTDRCGTYDYCDCCNMKENNPCENAYKRYTKGKKTKRRRGKNNDSISGYDFRATEER